VVFKNILAVNCGSSSIKCSLIDVSTDEKLYKGHVDGIGLPSCVQISECNEQRAEQPLTAKYHREAISAILRDLGEKRSDKIYAVGHRVVHGGEKYADPALIDEQVLADVEALCSLAPLHNPPNLTGIRVCRELMADTPQVAVFDTAFHGTIPAQNYLYALPEKFYREDGIRKYGFHGTSHKYVSSIGYKMLGSEQGNVVSCHLGNGSSITAIKDGKSFDTSMGFTPLDGVIMGTRCGRIDPGVILHLINGKKIDPAEVDRLLNRESGLLGLCGKSDLRAITDGYANGETSAHTAIEMLVGSIAFYIGGYGATLGGLDALIFTGGIGENSALIRELTCKRLAYLGCMLNQQANEGHDRVISEGESKVQVYVIPTDEELQIARETAEMLRNQG
jgi:acetate kinase